MSTLEDHQHGEDSLALRRALNKVPEISIYFWVTKILTTGMGEAASDYLQHQIGRTVAISVTAVALAAALIWQVTRRTYSTWIYWLAVVMVSVWGTMAADDLRHALHIPLWGTSLFYAVLVALIFSAWYLTERTLSVHTINTSRRESFYWATVLATFALGTAVGDWTADTLHLGYLGSGILFFALILIPAAVHWITRRGAVLWFWVAYVLTRPLGASFADWFDAPPRRHGLGLGTGPVALVSTLMIIGLVSYLAVSRRDRPSAALDHTG
jgi:uncharacterized membrane-anchored protein